MRKTVCFCLLIVLFPLSALAAECLSYEPVAVNLTGTILRKTFPGEPNYESVAKGDKPETVWLLKLPHSMCVKSGRDPLQEEEKDIQLVQLVLTPEQYQKYKDQVGKMATVSGSLFHSYTGHHHTKVLITVSGME